MSSGASLAPCATPVYWLWYCDNHGAALEEDEGRAEAIRDEILRRWYPERSDSADGEEEGKEKDRQQRAIATN